MKTFAQIGTAIGKLVQQKNKAYGSSFTKSGDFLRLLWPKGIPVGRFEDALLLVRIFDKQMRIATDKDAFGESPYGDIAGYGILGTHLHQLREAPVAPCVNASAAQHPSPAPSVSAAPDAPTQTTQSASERSEQISKRRWHEVLPNTSASTALTAHTAVNPSLSLGDALARVLIRNMRGQCGICTNQLPARRWNNLVDRVRYATCSLGCNNDFWSLLKEKQ